MGWLRGTVAVLSLVACGPVIDVDVDDGGATGGSSSTSSTSGSSDASTGITSSDPQSDSASTSDPDGSEASTGSPPVVCPGGDGVRPNGAWCSANDECVSGLCLEFSDAPPDVDAMCVEPAGDCATRFTGIAWSLPPDNKPVTGLAIDIHGLTELMADPAAAVALVQTEAAQPEDGRGRFDAFSVGPLEAAVGVVARMGGNSGWYRTATPLAFEIDGAYDLGIDVHDIWVVGAQQLEIWSHALANDPTIDPQTLPLGAAGGVVGIVRDLSGAPMVAATVRPDSSDSTAIVRYLRSDGTFDEDGTESTGVFVIMGAAGYGELFIAERDGAYVASGVTFSAPGLVFALALTGT